MGPAGLQEAETDGDGALHRYGIGGVGDEVGDGLFQFAGEAVDGGQAVKAAGRQRFLWPGVCGIEVEDGLDDSGHVDWLGDAGIAIEAEGLAGDVGNAFQLLLGAGEVFDDAGGRGGIGLGDEHEIEDGFERVVDFVRDGGGEARGGGQLFGLAKDLLRLALVGGVTEDEDDAEELVAVVANGSGAVFDGNQAPIDVFEYGVVGHGDDLACGQNFIDGIGGGLAGLFVGDREDIVNDFSGDIGELAAGERFGDGIHEGDVAACVGGDDAVADAGEGNAKPFFARAHVFGVNLAELESGGGCSRRAARAQWRRGGW